MTYVPLLLTLSSFLKRILLDMYHHTRILFQCSGFALIRTVFILVRIREAGIYSNLTFVLNSNGIRERGGFEGIVKCFESGKKTEEANMEPEDFLCFGYCGCYGISPQHRHHAPGPQKQESTGNPRSFLSCLLARSHSYVIFLGNSRQKD